MRLRSEVFVVEQDCVYLDLDDKDALSIHLFACEEEAAPGTAARAVVRLVPPGVSYDEPSIGRVAIDLASRGSGLGEELMTRAILACFRTWPGYGIRISAQQYNVDPNELENWSLNRRNSGTNGQCSAHETHRGAGRSGPRHRVFGLIISELHFWNQFTGRRRPNFFPVS